MSRKKLATAWADLPLLLKGLLVVSLPLGAVVFSAVLIGLVENQRDRSEAEIRQVMRIQTELQMAYVASLEAGYAVSGDAITQGDSWLQPADHSRTTLDRSVSRLEELMRDNPQQVQRLARFKEDVRDRLDVLGAQRPAYPSAADQNGSYAEFMEQGKQLLDRARAEYQDMLAAEDQSLSLETRRNSRRNTILQLVTAAASLIGLLGGLTGVFLFTSGIIRRVRSLTEGADQLQRGLPLRITGEGGDELGRLAKALGNTAVTLAKQRETITLSLEGARIAIFELDVTTGIIHYQVGLSSLKRTKFPEDRLPRNIEEFRAVLHPEDRDRISREVDKVLSQAGAFSFDYRVIAPGGEITWVGARGERAPLNDSNANRIRGVLVNITERKTAEQEIARQAQELARSEQDLRRQTQILKSVLDSMGDGVVVANQNGEFMVFNPAAQHILGRGATEGPAENWSERFGVYLPDMTTPYPNEDLPLVRAMLGESMDGANMFVRHPEMPEGAFLSVTGRPLRDDDGDAVGGGVVVIRDVSREKEAARLLEHARAEAERASQAKSEFLSRMSHELRTPLNAILGFAQLLELQELPEEQLDNVQHILRGGHHLLELVNEVLDLARIESGRLGLSPQPVPLREVLNDALELVQTLAGERKVVIRTDPAIGTHTHVLADRQRLKQVLLNLLSNAVKFNREGGSVSVGCEVLRGTRLRLDVCDTGFGMPEEDLKKLFRPFERLNADRSGIGGTGLGLALSKRLMDIMSGAIGVESTMGVGSRFWIELDLLERPLDGLQEGEPKSGESITTFEHDSPHGTVLYIEDNLSNLRLMERILAPYPGIKLLAAMLAKPGLDLARQHVPDWILLDLHLPDLHGEEVLRNLRLYPGTSKIPVTVVSADATPGQISRLMTAGAQDYLTKPLDVRKLLRLLEKTMRHGEALSQPKP